MWGSDPGLCVCCTRTSKRPTDVDGAALRESMQYSQKTMAGRCRPLFAVRLHRCPLRAVCQIFGLENSNLKGKGKKKKVIYFISHNVIFCFVATTTEDSHKAQPNPIHVNMFYSVHFLLLWTDIWGQPSKKCFVSMIIRNFKPLSAFGQHHTVLLLCHFTSWCDVLFSSPVIPALHLQLPPFNKKFKN